MQHDSADILGQENVPTGRPAPAARLRFSLGQVIFTSIVLWGVYAIGSRLWRRVLLWRERSHRLATRRRHGIPDSDLRPFNVAYSEAMTKARDEEKKRLKPTIHAQPLPAHREAQLDQNLRHRAGISPRPDNARRSSVAPVPGRYTQTPYESKPTAQSYMEHYNPRIGQFTHAPNPAGPLARQRGYVNVTDADTAVLSDDDSKKRTLDEDQEEQHEAKKSRVEGEEPIDDADAEAGPRRGSKRGLGEDDGDDLAHSGKRARQEPIADQSMDVDEEAALEEQDDEVAELKPISARGKKRDRAEAGSTFGGDEEDSEAEADDGKARRRRRKRRTVAKRKSEASYARGKKRDRAGEDEGSDLGSEDEMDSLERKSTSHKKKSKRDRDHSDVSMDESTTSTARTKVREIGDEWESNGVKYKIGLNNQRLRQALVKKARQKFVMPKDSQHPDRDTNLEVYVECWLTEEEYEDAKKQYLLAWQDPPVTAENAEKLAINTSATSNVPFPQGAAGKNLLWSGSVSSNSTPTVSPASSHAPSVEPFAFAENGRHKSYRETYRHSIATTVGLPISPFHGVRRISSSSQVIPDSPSPSPRLRASIAGSPGLADSTNMQSDAAAGVTDAMATPGKSGPRFRTYSKWEKQELEARAMMRMREANRKKEAEREARLRVERDQAERQRQESERVERERKEKLELERQRVQREADAEREKKNKGKDVPVIVLTEPTLENVGQQPSGAPGTSGGPSGFFSIPKLSAPTASATTASATTASAAPAASPFGGPKSDNVSTGSGEPPRSSLPKANPSPFSFGGFGGGSAASTSNPASSSSAAAPPKPNASSFANAAPLGFNSEPPKDNTTASTGTASSSGGSGAASSLLSRLGPQSETPKPDAQPAQGSVFGFGKQNASNSNPFGKQDNSNPFAKQESSNPFGRHENSNPFGQPAGNASSTTNNNSSNTSSSSTATTAPKFNFGFAGKPTSSNPASSAPKPALGASSSSLNGALGSTEQLKTTSGSAFGFKTPATPASFSDAANTASSTPTVPPPGAASSNSTNPTQPKFSFGTPGSTFGSTSLAQNKEPSKSVFGAGSAFSSSAGSGPSSFGAAASSNSAPQSNVFGGGANGSQTQNVFGGGSSSNNAASDTTPATSTEAPKPLFSFANPAVSSATTTPTAKPTFSFGGSSQTPATAPAASSSATSTTTPASTPAAAPFSFKFGGQSTTPSSSPFGAPASSTGGASSAFGSGIFGTANQQK